MILSVRATKTAIYNNDTEIMDCLPNDVRPAVTHVLGFKRPQTGDGLPPGSLPGKVPTERKRRSKVP
jgi:hypothetical protein